MPRLFAILGACFAFAAVALGAFGAHGLKKHFEQHPDLQAIFKTATEYHMYHALALLAVAWAAARWPAALTSWAGYCFIFGIAVFYGSLYILSLTNVRSWGAITPIGGVAFLAGWVCFALSAWKHMGR